MLSHFNGIYHTLQKTSKNSRTHIWLNARFYHSSYPYAHIYSHALNLRIWNNEFRYPSREVILSDSLSEHAETQVGYGGQIQVIFISIFTAILSKDHIY